MKKTLISMLASSMLLTACDKETDVQNSPDLTCAQVFSSIRIFAGGTIQEVVQIRNTGTAPTSGTIVFTISNYAPATGLLVFSNTSTSVTIGTTTYTLNNIADWDVSSSSTLLTFTSKPGVVIAAGAEKVVGITIYRAGSPNQGPEGPVDHAVTIASGTGGGETPGTNNTITNTIIKEAGSSGLPDLTPLQFYSSLQIPANGMIQEVVQIKNVGSGPTTAPIVFTHSTYTISSALSIGPNNNPTVTIGPDTYTLTNADWDFNISTGTFTSKAGVVIPAGGSKMVGITISRAAAPNQGANGTASSTVTISPGTGGGETPTTNNTATDIITKS